MKVPGLSLLFFAYSMVPIAGNTEDQSCQYEIGLVPDTHQIIPQDLQVFEKVFERLANSNEKALITGRTSGMGTIEYSIQLARSNAQFLADMLAHRGIAMERLSRVGVGRDDTGGRSGSETSASWVEIRLGACTK